jgi:hypothetical protein
LRVVFNTSDSLKKTNGTHLKIKFPLTETQIFEGRFEVAKDGKLEWSINDASNLKLVDKKDLTVSLKRKRFLLGSEKVDERTFKLTNLGT